MPTRRAPSLRERARGSTGSKTEARATPSSRSPSPSCVSSSNFHDHKAGVLAAVFAPDGATLATGSEDKTLRLQRLPPELIPPAIEKR
ncbi:MAG: hypothetical protein ACLP9L_11940 [Thermoguttaceae bacterium]